MISLPPPPKKHILAGLVGDVCSFVSRIGGELNREFSPRHNVEENSKFLIIRTNSEKTVYSTVSPFYIGISESLGANSAYIKTLLLLLLLLLPLPLPLPLPYVETK